MSSQFGFIDFKLELLHLKLHRWRSSIILG